MGFRGIWIGVSAAALMCVPVPAEAARGCKPSACNAPAGPVASAGEAAPPGSVLTLDAAENPNGLTQLARPLSPSQQLWADVRGHEPYGFNAYMSSRDFGPAVEAAVGAEAGASVARVPAYWGQVRYHRDSWYYTELDRIYRANILRGLRPLWVIQSSPRRFTIYAQTAPGSAQPGCGYDDFCVNPPAAAGLGDLGVFARDLARRYPLSAGVEVWNEPNLSNPYWGGEEVDPCRYAGVLKAVHDAVKLEAPNLPVLGGAVNNTNGGPGKMLARDFVAGMLRCGAGAAMDALSWHPYASPYNQSIAAGSQMIADGFADAGVPTTSERFVATEIGWATEAPWYTMDEKGQAAWLAWQMLIYDADWAGVPLTERTDGAFIHAAIVDPTPDRWNPWAASYGLTRRDAESGVLTPRPAFCKVRADFGGNPTCPDSFTP